MSKGDVSMKGLTGRLARKKRGYELKVGDHAGRKVITQLPAKNKLANATQT